MKTSEHSARDRKPEPRKARITPTGYILVGLEPRYWALWSYEWRWSEEKSEWETCKLTYNPKSLEEFEWAEEDSWEESLRRGLWGSFGEALDAYERHPDSFDGIGYVVGPDVPLDPVFVDDDEEAYAVVTELEGCRDPETGEIAAWAQKVIDEHASYAELSPSGTGVHLVGWNTRSPRSTRAFDIYGDPVEDPGGAAGERRFVAHTGVPL